jgi:hypothetical protein
VKWTVSTEEGGDVCKWWGAVIIGPSTALGKDGEQRTASDQDVPTVMLDELPLELAHQYVVKYESGEGFEEEEQAVVAFLSDREPSTDTSKCNF